VVGEKIYEGNRWRAVEVRDCDLSEDDQFFTANWDDNRFRIETPNGDGCLSNDHHPKPREELFSESCSRADSADTLYWEKYL